MRKITDYHADPSTKVTFLGSREAVGAVGAVGAVDAGGRGGCSSCN